MRGNPSGLQLFATFRQKLCNASVTVKVDNWWDTGTIRNPSAQSRHEGFVP